MDVPRHYSVWRCQSCGHLVARDLIDPVPPERCRHPRGTCKGAYRRHLLWDDPDEPGWRDGQIEAAEVSAVHYALMLEDREYAAAHLQAERAKRAAARGAMSPTELISHQEELARRNARDKRRKAAREDWIS
jgi:hypothetical protein